MSAQEIPTFDPLSAVSYTQETLYLPEDIACAEKDWPEGEVEQAFAAYRKAVEIGDHATMAKMLADGGRGGNATFGFFPDRDSYEKFLNDCWLEMIPNRNVWTVIEGGRVINKWRESLPGTTPDGQRYDYFGINEVIYAGNGQFRYMYSLPDLFGIQSLYMRWKADGQHETYGDIYAGMFG